MPDESRMLKKRILLIDAEQGLLPHTIDFSDLSLFEQGMVAIQKHGIPIHPDVVKGWLDLKVSTLAASCCDTRSPHTSQAKTNFEQLLSMCALAPDEGAIIPEQKVFNLHDPRAWMIIPFCGSTKVVELLHENLFCKVFNDVTTLATTANHSFLRNLCTAFMQKYDYILTCDDADPDVVNYIINANSALNGLLLIIDPEIDAATPLSRIGDVEAMQAAYRQCAVVARDKDAPPSPQITIANALRSHVEFEAVFDSLLDKKQNYALHAPKFKVVMRVLNVAPPSLDRGLQAATAGYEEWTKYNEFMPPETLAGFLPSLSAYLEDTYNLFIDKNDAPLEDLGVKVT